MKVFAVLAIFTLCSLSVSTGLQCYDCVYADGASHSQWDCESNPPQKYLITCPTANSLSDESSQLSRSGSIILKALEKPDTSLTGLGDPICFVLTGEVDGKKAIERRCDFAHREEDLNGKCEDLPDMGNVKKLKKCFCTSNSCNHGNNNHTNTDI